MYFRLQKTAASWFSELSSDLLAFDIYYFLLIAGISSGKKRDTQQSESTDIIDRFPKDYLKSSKLIIGLLLRAELDSLGINMEDRKEVKRALSILVTQQTSSNLSDSGIRIMNQYAAGGFEVLFENFDDKPRTMETFLIQYDQLIDSLLD